MSKVAYVSSYPPRECGIATFTQDLVRSINSLHTFKPASIVSINDAGASYDYGKEVKLQIDEEDEDTYRQVAHEIDNSDFDLVNVQHEFGLFGGRWGSHFLVFLKELHKPVVTTLHTVLSPASPRLEALGHEIIHQKVVKEIAQRSAALVVMVKTAYDILRGGYSVDIDKIRIIPHGCPDVPFVPSSRGKESLGLGNRVVLSTFGLLSQDKGIEHAIRALPEIVKEDPRVLYLVIGETHPKVRLREGEKYRKWLMRLVRKLGLRKHVKFHNRYLTKRELIRYLQATDIYVCPYISEDQLSSGTLTYALGTGKAIVSTPFYYALDVLAEGRGLLCKFKSPPSISQCVNQLLKNPELKTRLETLAYEYSRNMTWPQVASKHVSLFKEAVSKK